MTLPDPLPDPPRDEPRRVPSTFGGLVYLVIVANTVVGLLVVAFGPWRRGVGEIAIGLLVGAVMRTVLSDRDAGMLRVRRSRVADVLMLAGVGTALLVLVNVIPNQPS